jgi:hypothetical protein
MLWILYRLFDSSQPNDGFYLLLHETGNPCWRKVVALAWRIAWIHLRRLTIATSPEACSLLLPGTKDVI